MPYPPSCLPGVPYRRRRLKCGGLLGKVSKTCRQQKISNKRRNAMGKILGINGSPRLNWNCATLLDHALRGAESAGADTERIDLQKLHYSGCISCFQCKRIGGPSFGRCIIRDDLTSILNDIVDAADGVIVSCPVYFADVPAMVRALLERLWFPGYPYSSDGTVTYPHRVPMAFIFTMNTSDASMYNTLWSVIEGSSERIVGPVSSLKITNTLQFDDYSKYASAIFNPEDKRRHHDEHFPIDCKSAYDLGASFAAKKA